MHLLWLKLETLQRCSTSPETAFNSPGNLRFKISGSILDVILPWNAFWQTLDFSCLQSTSKLSVKIKVCVLNLCRPCDLLVAINNLNILWTNIKWIWKATRISMARSLTSTVSANRLQFPDVQKKSYVINLLFSLCVIVISSFLCVEST